MLGLCLFATFAFMPWNVFVRPSGDMVDVWFGFEFTGVAARFTAILHWVVYAVGAWGFYRMRSWMWPWAAVYMAQVAVGHIVWSELSANGRGLTVGIVQAAVLSIPAVMLFASGDYFLRSRR